MKIELAKLLLAFVSLSPFFSFAQKGKDSTYTTISVTNTVVNTYTYLTANTVAGSSITVNSNTMPNTMGGGVFTGNLAPGDLIMIIQMQGATMDIDLTVSLPSPGGWGANYTTPNGHTWDGSWMFFQDLWGQVTGYNNAGKYELREVLSVTGANTINLTCALQNSYTASGHTQIVRIPRFKNLTLNAATSVVPSAWNGQTGGVVAIEVNGDLVIGAGAKISASAMGFRGASANNPGVAAGPPVAHTYGDGNGYSYLGTFSGADGARKGEGIGGYTTEYVALYSEYGRSAPANGGGGGGHSNSGGGGGSNIGTGAYTGKGVPTTTFGNGPWNLELAGFGGSSSSGGGRGGYSLSLVDRNGLTVNGPNEIVWGGNARKENGGLGGHPLLYDATRLFMGGGGGAGEGDTFNGTAANQAGAGGAGGGIVYVVSYGTISGTGILESHGAVGQNTNPLLQAVAGSPGSTSNKRGNDGAGGGGAGGSIFIKNIAAIPATISITANGGIGGNQVLTIGAGALPEAAGPGGGGGGGNITITSGTPIQSYIGGVSGTTNSSQLTEFNVNGATNGAAGVVNPVSTIFNYTANNVTICQGTNPTLTAVVTGTLPGTLNWYSVPFGGSSLGTGATYTIPLPLLAAGVYTYYVGVCPGTFRIPVKVTVNPKPIISGVAVLTNPNCLTAGSITGLTVSGGSPGYTYSWSGTTTVGPDYTNIPAGTYSLTVTDIYGCTDTDGPHALVGISGPIINVAAAVVQNQLCNGTLGSITGITATGSSLTYSWSNSGGSSLNANNLVAGNYTLTVTDGVGCTATSGPYTVNFIAGPTVDASGIIITTETCGNANGAISGITATGTGLTYTWNAITNPSLSISSQVGGSYTLVVSDVNGCTVSSGPHVIPSIAAPTISTIGINVMNENCNQANGSITGLTIVGGTPNFTISWSNTAQTTMDISNLVNGQYTLTVTDFNNCVTTSGPYDIANLAGPVLDVTGVVLQNELCNGTMGSISGITATGTGLIYSWSNSGGSSLNATNLSAGSYTLTVTNGAGCNATAGPYVLNYIAGPSVDASAIVISPATCGNNNGSINGITATGNGLTYTWNAISSTSLNLPNQGGGNYTLVITDNNGCTVSSGPYSIPIIASPIISIGTLVIVPENCNLADGSISGITISGGSPIYSCVWTGTSQTTLDINNLSAGSYSLTVTDQNGCIVNMGPFSVTNSGGPNLDETNVVVTNLLCDGTLATISGITAAGTGLIYSWSNGGGNSLDITGLDIGTYILTVTDVNGCTYNSLPYTVSPLVPFDLDLLGLQVTQTSCTSNTGTVTGMVVVGGVNPVVSWTNSAGTFSANTIDLANLPFGTYTITASDDQGCSESWTVNITQLNAPMIDLSLMVLSPEHCGQSDASITGVSAVGGFGAYTYMWNNDPLINTPDLTGLVAGVYTVTVTDVAGCFDQEIITVTGSTFPIISITNLLVNQITCLTNGSISGIQVTGAQPITYSWTGTTQTTLDITNLTAGNYTLTATDNFGCISSFGPIIFVDPVPPIASFTWSPNAPVIFQNVDFTNTSTGIGLISTWTIDGQQFVTNNAQYAFNDAGDFVVTLSIVDGNGCVSTVSNTISVFGDLVIPNVITMNGDDINESFIIQGLKPNSSLIIINRWGDVVLDSDNYLNDWKGIDVSGKELTEGVYTYLLKEPDGNLKHGIIHLIR
ncbi:MAG: hypothetical protein RI883_1131 [Bacteroidota bacterium]|jgi:hypothetical protein